MAEIKFISWSEIFKKIDTPYFLSYRDLTLLNTLAPTYHSGFGYDIDDIRPESEADLPYQLNLIPKLVIARDDDYILVNTGVAEDFSTNHLLRHKTIAVRLNPEDRTGWEHKPGKINKTCFHSQIASLAYWYEFPAEIYKSYSKTCNLVGPLSDRHYIHVIDLFDEIELRSEEKGNINQLFIKI